MTDPHNINEAALPTPAGQALRNRLIILGLAGMVAVVGLSQVKWLPLKSKVAAAFEQPSISPSILGGGAPLPPAPSLETGLRYTMDYFGAVWMAVVLGIVLGGAVMALVPRWWLQRYLGKSSLGAVLWGGVGAMPGMF